MEKVEERTTRFELDEEVNIAGVVVVAHGDRSEERDREAPVTAGKSLDRFSIFLDEFTKGLARCPRHLLIVRLETCDPRSYALVTRGPTGASRRSVLLTVRRETWSGGQGPRLGDDGLADGVTHGSAIVRQTEAQYW